MANTPVKLVYRKNTTPLINPGVTFNKGTPLTNDQMDGNFIGIQESLHQKADIESPTFTGLVTIPTVDINAGNIDGTVIGASAAAAALVTTLSASGTITGPVGTWSATGLNSVIIGATTPVAASFTTLSATGTVTGPSGTWSATGLDLAIGDAYSINGVSLLTSASLTNPIIFGGTLAASTLALRASSNASPSGHSITVGGSNSGASNSGTTTIQGATVNILVGAAASSGFLKVAATTGLTSIDTATYLTGANVLFVGSTSIALNRTTAPQALTGITSIDGSAATLTTSRNINGVAFNGSGDITITVAAGTLTGTTLAAGVTASSLTSVGTIATGVWSGTAVGATKGGTGQTVFTVGDILYASTTSALSKLGPGSSGQILNITGGIPAWIDATGLSAGNSLTASNLLGGLAGQVPYQVAVNSTGFVVAGTTDQIFKSNGAAAPSWTSSLNLSGTVTHGGLTPSAGTAVDQLYTASDAAFVVDNTWKDTSVNAAELASGSYIVQVTTGTEIYTGYMSWYGSDTNATISDEVALHRASIGTEESGSPLFLKTIRTVTADAADMKLQITSTITRASATYTYKFRRMI